MLLVAPWVFRAPEAPAAREARRPHFVRRRASKPGQAPPPPTGTAAAPSGALHTSGAVSLACGLVRVVTNVVNPRSFSCGFLIRCYKRRQSDGFFAENQGFWTQIDDVCNMITRKGGSNCSGLTTFVTSAAHWSPGQALPPPTII